MNTVEFLLKNITLSIIFNKSVTYLQEKNKKIKKISLLIITSCSSWGLIFSLPNSAQEFRSFDGSRNNLINQNWGIAGSQLIRLTSAKYDDGISAPAGKERPSARIISNLIGSQSTSIPNSLQVTNWFWQWGQFLDHDLDLTPPHSPLETFDIAVPQADLFFDPQGSGRQTISFNRSLYINRGIRQQINEITSYIDASMIYGSDQLRASTLRANDGTGKLKASSGNLLMLNEVGLANDGGTSPDLFLSGDIRVNENIGLTATHTLFFREHNRLATEILAKLHQQEPILTRQFQASNLSQAEFIYQTARKIVGAQIQVITYQEFLPLLLGKNNLGEYQGYDPQVNATISNEFSTAAFRFGHTMLPKKLKLIQPVTIPLREAFFKPEFIKNNGIDFLLMGLAKQIAEEIDTLVVDDVRNFLFGLPGAGGFDLLSLNIQRGRDHGLGSYNDVREELGLKRITNFSEITSDLGLQTKLANAYENIDQIDLFIGGLAENDFASSLIGETFHTIITDQFVRLRTGDRFFYLNDPDLLAIVPEIKNVRLSDIIRRNSNADNIQDNVFLLKAQPTPESSSNLFSLLFIYLIIVKSYFFSTNK